MCDLLGGDENETGSEFDEVPVPFFVEDNHRHRYPTDWDTTLLMFAQEMPPRDRTSGLIRSRIEPLVAASSGF
jgi:hypothetical protein